MTYFPYINYVRVSDVLGTVVRLTDSLNTPMMEALARHLNFSYVVCEPEDGLWSLRTSTGNWTGTVGTLQHEKADFSMDLTLTPQRTAVLDFCRVYIGEEMAILSLKPRPLPEYLHGVSGRGGEHHGVGHGAVAVASYTCSLISHLVVQGKSVAINSLEELVELQRSKGWEWGTRTFDGAFNSLLTISTNQDYQTVKTHMQTLETDIGIKRVLEGGFSYIRNYYVTRILMETYHSREAGDNPFHIATARYPLFAGNTWAFSLISRITEMEQRQNYQEDYSSCDNLGITDLRELSGNKKCDKTTTGQTPAASCRHYKSTSSGPSHAIPSSINHPTFREV
ncbi:hypothetical protein O3P69_002615 [Scylla paramamosain]|uniref:Ionotropic glutamate receptor L-glutamate and glycine-binding domain-containing protein n=1 Tax=Scylla paramamosain TaxID=85552 RepID=A0AAW0UQ52_SCYPA